MLGSLVDMSNALDEVLHVKFVQRFHMYITLLVHC